MAVATLVGLIEVHVLPCGLLLSPLTCCHCPRAACQGQVYLVGGCLPAVWSRLLSCTWGLYKSNPLTMDITVWVFAFQSHGER